MLKGAIFVPGSLLSDLSHSLQALFLSHLQTFLLLP